MSQYPTLDSLRRACLVLARSFGGEIADTAFDSTQLLFFGTVAVRAEVATGCVFVGTGETHRDALVDLYKMLAYAVRGAQAYAAMQATTAKGFARALATADDHVAFMPAAPLFASCARCHREWRRHEWPGGNTAVPLSMTCPCGAIVSPITTPQTSALPADGSSMGSRTGWLCVRETGTDHREELPSDTECAHPDPTVRPGLCALRDFAPGETVWILDRTEACGYWIATVEAIIA